MEHIKGAFKLADLVSITAGAQGRTVWIDSEQYATKDGFNICRDFELKDKKENAGVSILKQSALNTMRYGGDGTTLTCILAREFIRPKYIFGLGKVSINDLEGIQKTIIRIKKQIDEMKMRVDSRDTLKKIAMTSSNGDEEISEKISELVWNMGVDGLLLAEQSVNEGIEVDVVDGFSFNEGFLDGVFVNTTRGSCELKNPIVYVGDHYNISDVKGYLDEAFQTKRPIVLFGLPDDQALLGISQNHSKGNIVACCVGIHGKGRSRDRFIQDLKQVVKNGIEKIVIKRHQTIIQSNIDLSDYITTLKNEELPTNNEKDEQKERIARLEGKVGVIRIGSKTQAEERERLDRVDDAIRACQSALKDGYVIGGGHALLRCRTFNDIVKRAIKAPYKQLCKNARLPADGTEWNLRTRLPSDMIAEGILDSSLCIKLALDNAFSAAKEIIKLNGFSIKDSQ